ncbi:MAG: nucleoside hydrolase [Candidatus Bathyarchaeia archaeon]
MVEKRVLLDTDIGTDVDDLLALALALNSSEIKLEGVMTVSLEAEKRTRLAMKVLRTAGRTDVPVVTGLSKPLLRKGEAVWGRYDGHGVNISDIPEPPRGNAVGFLVSSIMGSPGELTLLTVGPLTNIAAALIMEPAIARNVKDCFIMGGIVYKTPDRNDLREYNVSSDPEAANIVFSSGMPITMVGLDVTLKVALDRARIERISASKRPLASLAASAAVNYQERMVKRPWNHLHDPLTVGALIDRSLVKTRTMTVALETRGALTDGWMVAKNAQKGTGNCVEVAVEVETERFLDFFEERLARS